MKPNNIRNFDFNDFKELSVELDYLSEFLNDLSDLISGNGILLPYIANSEIHFFTTGLISSASNTINSIKLCCTIGAIADSNTLIRKLRDDLFQYLYILSIIKSRKTFSNFNQQILELNECNEDELAVNGWFNNSVSKLPYSVKKKLEFENYMSVLKQNSNIDMTLEKYDLKAYWDNLRKSLNDFVHNNGIQFSNQNFNHSKLVDLRNSLTDITQSTEFVVSLFFISILMIDSTMVLSSDLIAYLDNGMEPPEGSQFSIAGFVQDFIDNKVKVLHPELKQFLVDNNSHGMRIE